MSHRSWSAPSPWCSPASSSSWCRPIRRRASRRAHRCWATDRPRCRRCVRRRHRVRPVATQRQLGRPHFFTHNCVPCIREHPDLIEFVDQQRSLGVDGAEFYSIVRDSTHEEVDAFFVERGGDWPVVYDTDFEFVNQFGVALVPETWIIDPNGFVRRRIISEVRADELSQLMQAPPRGCGMSGSVMNRRARALAGLDRRH